jgi:oxalate decarboxylase/phosphoglucose isomerase-like protein (cupin superfamily)
LAGAFRRLWRTRDDCSPTIVSEVEPGKRLGWHTDATEETQYIIAGTGKLYLEDGTTHQVGPGSVFVLPTPMRHDLENTGKETLRAVAFFAAAMFMQGLREAHCLSQRPPRFAPMVEQAQTELWDGPPYPPRTMVEVKRLFDDDIVEIDSVFYAPVKN